jgi:hypothetical protein
VYVLLSHRYPERVQRLVRRILSLSPEAAVLVRHDARHSEPPSFDTPRVVVESHSDEADWGSWELASASLAAMNRAAKLFDAGLVVLVSGQDYPCRNLAEWEREVVASEAGWVCAFLHELHYRPRWGRRYGQGDDALSRYIYHWHRIPGGQWLHRSVSRLAGGLRWIISRLGHYLEPILAVRVVMRGRGYHVGFRTWRAPFDAANPCLMGSQWVAMERGRLETLTATLAQERSLRRAYRRSIIPDESMIQTILGRQGPPMRDGLVSYNVWEATKDAPRTLTLADLPDILSSGAAFCRKLEPGPSDELADALDRVTEER